MATYKVIQDIEAEDKLIGNLSFRQFVYALVCVSFLYFSYLFYSKHVGAFVIITLPISLFSGFLAFPFGKDQPTEVWALAKIRFILKPRKRIWAQSGVKELVTITVPKKIEIIRTDGLSQIEVKSRLQALANTIDSRGWAIKNVSSVYQNPLDTNQDSDRLITTSQESQSVPDFGVQDTEDVFDDTTKMDQLITASGALHRQQLIQTLGQVKLDSSQQYPGLPAPQGTSFSGPVAQTSTAPVDYSQQATTTIINEDALSAELKSNNTTHNGSLNHMRALKLNAADNNSPVNMGQPPFNDSVSNQGANSPAAASPKIQDPVIMNLSKRNDLNVNVLAHEVDRAKGLKVTNSGDEVLVSLH
jgi:hypothetical protein